MSDQPICLYCGRDEFEEEDGILTCVNCGQRVEGAQQVAEDETFGIRGKVNRKQKDKRKVRTSRVSRGAKGRKLYVQAWQYILWKQCYALIHGSSNLPEKLWIVVKDLWTLRLSSIERELEDNDDDHEIPDSSLVENQEGSNTQLRDQDANTKSRTSLPRLWDTISTIYLGVLLLQHPLTLRTLYDYIRKEEICFIRAIHSVPQDILVRLPSEYHIALDPMNIPKPEDFQHAITRMIVFYQDTFEMKIPGINWLPILYQHIETLAIPVEIFLTVKHLASFLNYNFCYQPEDRALHSVIKIPDTRLMALVVVATKLLFPFDVKDLQIHPYSLNEPAALKIDWTRWEAAKDQVHSNADGKAHIEMKDTDILRMTSDQLDSYMNWYQRTWIQTEVGKESYQPIIEMFPLQNFEHASSPHKTNLVPLPNGNERLNWVQESLEACEAISKEASIAEEKPLLRPGQHYQRYRTLDNLSGPALTFHQEAAKLACVSLESLLTAVVRAENKIIKQQYKQRRADVYGYDLHDAISRRVETDQNLVSVDVDDESAVSTSGNILQDEANSE